jgi:hypothetical protein
VPERNWESELGKSPAYRIVVPRVRPSRQELPFEVKDLGSGL